MYKPSPSHQQFLNIITEQNRKGFATGGTYKDYVSRGEEYKDLTFEEWLQEDKPGYKPSKFGRVDKAIGGGVIEGEDLGTREGFFNVKKTIKYTKPDLFNKIIELAEEGKTSVRAIGKHPEVVALNNGKEIQYGSLQRIITNEKGPKFFKDLTKVKQYFVGDIRKGALENLDSIMDDYYKGDSTIKLTKKYFPNSTEAKAGKSSTVLESVIKENTDPEKLKKRPVIIGSNQIGTREEQIKTLKKFQDYLAKNINKFTSKSVMESNLKDLFKGSDSGTLGNFVARANALRKIYNDKTSPEGFKVNEKVKNLIKYIPAQDFVEEELRALGFSEKTIKAMNDVEYAVQKITNSSTMFEHALPRSLIRSFNLPKKFYLVGERTSNFLNKFKMQFDGQLKNAAEGYAQSDQSPADYKKYKAKVKEIRDKVRKYTGGYEIGYVDFDANGRAIPITPQSSLLEGQGELGKRTTGIKNFFKNMKFHNRLFENYKKNKNNPDFFTLNDEIKKSNLDFVPEYEIEKEYDKIKNFNKISQFQNYFKKVPDSNFFKALFTGKGGKVALTGATVAGALTLPTLLAAQEIEPGSPGQINPEKDTGIPEEALAAGTLGTIKYGPQVLNLLKKGAGSALRTVSSPTGATFFGLSEILDYKKPSEDASALNRLDPRNYKVQEDPNVTTAGISLLLPEIAKTAGLKSKILNPFNVGRAFTPLGIATILGSEGYKIYKQFEELEKLKREDPEAYEAFRKTRVADELSTPEDFAEIEEMGTVGAANGGLITRQAFKDGFDPKKRQTVKILGGLASIPILGKYLKILGPLSPKVVETVERSSDAVPTFLYDLIAKVKAKGMKFFTGNRADEFEYVYERDGYQVREQGNKITVRKRVDDGEMLDKDMEMELEVDPETGGLTYKEATARPDDEGKLKDVEEYIEDVDLEEMRKYTYDE